MMVGSIVILVIFETWLVASSPFAVNSVANGGSSALLAANSSLPSVVKSISSTRVLTAGADRLHDGIGSGDVEVDDLEGTVAVTGIEPPAVRGNTVRAGLIVVHRRSGRV